MPVQRLGIVIQEGVQALDVAGPVDVFAETNAYIPAADRYETVLIGPRRAPLRASNNMQIIADVSLEEATGLFDVLLVAGSHELPYVAPDPQLVAWLRQAPEQAGLYGSICTGAFALGHAGLLDGHQVTTHWQVAQKLAAQFPAAIVEPDLIYVGDGRLVTSAGVTAGIDLALALISQQHGPGVAVAVAKRLVVVAQRQGGQSQFSPYLTAPADPASPIARIQDYVMTHIGCRHSLASLAAVVGMSARNFARHFVQETGITPPASLSSGPGSMPPAGCLRAATARSRWLRMTAASERPTTCGSSSMSGSASPRPSTAPASASHKHPVRQPISHRYVLR